MGASHHLSVQARSPSTTTLPPGKTTDLVRLCGFAGGTPVPQESVCISVIGVLRSLNTHTHTQSIESRTMVLSRDNADRDLWVFVGSWLRRVSVPVGTHEAPCRAAVQTPMKKGNERRRRAVGGRPTKQGKPTRNGGIAVQGVRRLRRWRRLEAIRMHVEENEPVY